MHSRTRQFKKDLPGHLANEQMRTNVARATWISLSKRAQVVAEVPNWEELRERAHQIKRQVIDALPENLQRFEAQARRQGVEVLHAADAREANRLAEEIARRHRVKQIVKSKSMLTEEIDFNHYMIERGFEVIESDLGEYILQLADEPPSHLTGPAIHKSRLEIARLFHEKLGIPYCDDPVKLTAVARDILRGKFLSAQLGVTGANFGIVENGSIVLVENEGNARMCSTLPPVHVAFIGMERLIPAAADLAVFLTLLGRSATGQKMTSFVSVVGGPRPPCRGEPQAQRRREGPENVYYIIVDNGRSSFLQDEHLKEALYCIRCGACYNTCPVYQNIGGHAYGWVYQGPIGAVITPQLLGLKEAPALPFASSLCGSCSEICPVKIPLHHLLLYQRSRVVAADLTSLTERLVVRNFVWMAGSAKRFGRAGEWAGRLQGWMNNKIPVPGWSASRETPKLARQSFHQWWAENGERLSQSDEPTGGQADEAAGKTREGGNG